MLPVKQRSPSSILRLPLISTCRLIPNHPDRWNLPSVHLNPFLSRHTPGNASTHFHSFTMWHLRAPPRGLALPRLLQSIVVAHSARASSPSLQPAPSVHPPPAPRSSHPAPPAPAAPPPDPARLRKEGLPQLPFNSMGGPPLAYGTFHPHDRPPSLLSPSSCWSHRRAYSRGFPLPSLSQTLSHLASALSRYQNH